MRSEIKVIVHKLTICTVYDTFYTSTLHLKADYMYVTHIEGLNYQKIHQRDKSSDVSIRHIHYRIIYS